MPMSKTQALLNVGLPPKLLADFYQRMPVGYSKTLLIAAALHAFSDVDATDIPAEIAHTVSKYYKKTSGAIPEKEAINLPATRATSPRSDGKRKRL